VRRGHWKRKAETDGVWNVSLDENSWGYAAWQKAGLENIGSRYQWSSTNDTCLVCQLNNSPTVYCLDSPLDHESDEIWFKYLIEFWDRGFSIIFVYHSGSSAILGAREVTLESPQRLFGDPFSTTKFRADPTNDFETVAILRFRQVG